MFRPIETVETNVLTSSSTTDARGKIIECLSAQGGKITSESSQEVAATFGSNLKMRLLGLTFAGVDTFPREVIVKLSEVGAETQIAITVRDTAGFGSRMGYIKVFELLMQKQALHIKANLPDAH
jgi:hypothetical protein